MADIPKLAPAAVVIFGITGDLARRKLLPALYHLAEDRLLPENFRVIGVTRSGTTVGALLDDVRTRLNSDNETCDEESLNRFGESMQILTMDISKAEEYTKIKQALAEHEAKAGVCTSRLFYLSVPPQTFGSISHLLGKAGLTKGCEHRVGESRLLIEKPFGYDLPSAKELIATLSQDFNEQQIYRVDHYLAKETAQNILTFRFNNPLFWGQTTGALRDIIQSHLIQLLALVAMERPRSMNAVDIHAQKLELLQSIKQIAPDKVAEQAVRGQYAGYLGEVGNHSSTTETFAALRLEIDSPRWRGVPILLRTGKAMAEKATEITLVFKDEPGMQHQNTLTFRIQPNEGISLELQVKKPGFDDIAERTQMDFCYDQTRKGVHPDAYERVLVDALRGDKTLFATSDEVLASWHVVEHVLHAWSMGSADMELYAKGSWGPQPADELAENVGTSWASKRLRICA